MIELVVEPRGIVRLTLNEAARLAGDLAVLLAEEAREGER